MSKQTIQTPVEGVKTPSFKPSGGSKEFNGESKMPQRSMGKDSIPEVTYDNVGGKK